ncbi:hypothetical protein [Amycolatopsis sp. WQ 127309]|uniref:hypothetical protein n=1 Tax=Amycolatopsis sp. WQ 127309 TaxID=2932773 RepID=UPI001FF13DE9|nr:hypothetical protein [Amycolatopsis sp. WQ 127309]UOZ10697.1 hypothetical protein MUY22_21495 [Amycolatopsis sp. WQ 127309]
MLVVSAPAASATAGAICDAAYCSTKAVAELYPREVTVTKLVVSRKSAGLNTVELTAVMTPIAVLCPVVKTSQNLNRHTAD